MGALLSALKPPGGEVRALANAVGSRAKQSSLTASTPAPPLHCVRKMEGQYCCLRSAAGLRAWKCLRLADALYSWACGAAYHVYRAPHMLRGHPDAVRKRRCESFASPALTCHSLLSTAANSWLKRHWLLLKDNKLTQPPLAQEASAALPVHGCRAKRKADCP